MSDMIGEFLMNIGAMTQDQVHEVLRAQRAGYSKHFGEIAKEHGFETVYYADLETLSVLGVWTQQYVHVYGTRNAP